MLKILKNKEVQKSLFIYKNTKLRKSCCLHCANPRCILFNQESLVCSKLPDFTSSIDNNVCPVNAISVKNGKIAINSSLCFGCGLCASACPMDAISIINGKASVNDSSDKNLEELPVNEQNIGLQEKCIEKCSIERKNEMLCTEDNATMKRIIEKVKKLGQEKQNILVRNILILLGNHVIISRKGVVYMRLDGFYQNDNQMGAIEVETGNDPLEASRAILDDVAVLNTRHNIPIKQERPLTICLVFPNKRTDYWQVIKDVKKIINLEIQTITIGALLILLWNKVKLDDISGFYVDSDNRSIRNVVERLLKRKVHIPVGYLGILENEK